MFSQTNVYGIVQAFGVRVKDEREADRNHLVEVVLEVPLTYDMANDILPAMARDLFLSVKGEMHPRPEMKEAVFELAPPQQIFEARNHPDLPLEVRIEGVTIRKIRAVKTGATWSLRFTATWTLGLAEEVQLMIQRLKLGLYLTFIEQQPQLKPEAPITADDQQADAATRDDAPADGKKPKRRGKKNPEGEAQAQRAEGLRLVEGGADQADGDQADGKDAQLAEAAADAAADADAVADGPL
jgi:hypothetical protein